eukprot:5501901-Karenia_brevis.AAC.1
MVSLSLAADEWRFGIHEQGWHWHKEKPQAFPCVTGFERRARTLPKPAGFHNASPRAQERWQAASWPTPVYNFEDEVCVWASTEIFAEEVQQRCFADALARLPSVLELERAFDLPEGYTACGAATEDKRRNALGNALSVREGWAVAVCGTVAQ